MEVIIKNRNNYKAKALIFGDIHRCNLIDSNPEKDCDFFDFTTDDGVEITIDGNEQIDIVDVLARTFRNPIKISLIDFYSNKDGGVYFKWIQTDANGELHVTPIYATTKPDSTT